MMEHGLKSGHRRSFFGHWNFCDRTDFDSAESYDTGGCMMLVTIADIIKALSI